MNQSDNTNRMNCNNRNGAGMMQVTVLDRTIVYANEAESVNKLMKDVNDLFAERRLVIKSMIIDEQEVYDEFEDVLLDRLNDIRIVHIIEQTREEAANQVCLSAASYLDRSMPQMQLLYTELYQNSTADTWDRLTQLIDGLQWLYDISDLLSKENLELSLNDRFHFFMQKVNAIVPDLVPALENKDAIAIADIIKFELLPAFRDLKDGLQHIIDNKVVRADVN
jgi:hypothetical protein